MSECKHVECRFHFGTAILFWVLVGITASRGCIGSPYDRAQDSRLDALESAREK